MAGSKGGEAVTERETISPERTAVEIEKLRAENGRLLNEQMDKVLAQALRCAAAGVSIVLKIEGQSVHLVDVDEWLKAKETKS
jgi:hypothetical protein